MAMVSVTITGDRELNRKLGALKGPKQKKAVRTASRASLKPLAAAIKRAAPRGDTGTLARAVKVRAIKRSRVRVGSRVSLHDKAFKNTVFYGGFIELGRRGVEENDFMRRTAEARRHSVLADYRHRLKQVIIQLAREG